MLPIVVGMVRRRESTVGVLVALSEEGCRRMPQVFISHAVQDFPFVKEELFGLCRALDLTIWFSEQEIDSADQWERTIKDALEASDWFILVMSRRSAASEWVRNELHWALSHMPDAVIPLLIEECPIEEFHIALPRVQHIDFRTNPRAARERLISKVVKANRLASDYTPGRKAALIGAWDSYWETKASNESDWVAERLYISSRSGLHSVQAVNNTGGYNWSGQGRFITNVLFGLVWWVNHPGAESTGAGTFYRNAEGHYLVGHWYGVNIRGAPAIGRWIIVKATMDPVLVTKEWFGASARSSLDRFLVRTPNTWSQDPK